MPKSTASRSDAEAHKEMRQMIDILSKMGVSTAGVLTQERDWDTHVYTKPIEKNQELNRIDYGNFNQLASETAANAV